MQQYLKQQKFSEKIIFISYLEDELLHDVPS